MKKHISFKKPKVTKTSFGKYTVSYKTIDGSRQIKHTSCYETEEEALKEYNDYLIEAFKSNSELLHKLPKCIHFVRANNRFKFQVTIDNQTLTLFSSYYLYEVIEYRSKLLSNILGI